VAIGLSIVAIGLSIVAIGLDLTTYQAADHNYAP
jgi:hypothetical protein